MEQPAPKEPLSRRRLLLSAAFVVFLGLAVYSAAQIILELWEYRVSGHEYQKLRELYEPPEEIMAVAPESESSANLLAPDAGEFSDPSAEAEEESAPVEAPVNTMPSPPRDPAEINAEYIGWLKLSGGIISYPMAQSADNDKYLHLSFEGRKSGLGAIFMDYRCSGDFRSYHSIIYGHNVKNGAMFGSLAKYLDAAYLEKNREITITLPSGEKEIWYIFAARKSNITDYAYRLDFSGPQSFAYFAESLGAPAGASRLLTLSTCTSGGGNDERMLVFAAIND